jgi:hypothetical protein
MNRDDGEWGVGVGGGLMKNALAPRPCVHYRSSNKRQGRLCRCQAMTMRHCPMILRSNKIPSPARVKHITIMALSKLVYHLLYCVWNSWLLRSNSGAEKNPYIGETCYHAMTIRDLSPFSCNIRSLC